MQLTFVQINPATIAYKNKDVRYATVVSKCRERLLYAFSEVKDSRESTGGLMTKIVCKQIPGYRGFLFIIQSNPH